MQGTLLFAEYLRIYMKQLDREHMVQMGRTVLALGALIKALRVSVYCIQNRTTVDSRHTENR